MAVSNTSGSNDLSTQPFQRLSSSSQSVFSAILLACSLFGLLCLFRISQNILAYFYVHFFHTSKLRRYTHPDAWALVTGASDGIGKALVHELASHGFHVVLHGRNQVKLEGVVSGLQQKFPSSSFKIVVADATNSHGMKAAILRIAKELDDLPGPLTVLVNNIGAMNGIYGSRTPMMAIQEQEPMDLDAVINVNARFTAHITRAVLPILAKTQAPGQLHHTSHTAHVEKPKPFLILNLSSVAAYWPTPLLSAYAGSKGFIETWSHALSQELAMQPRYSKGESLCLQIGEVTGAGGIVKQSSFLVTDTETIAKAIIQKIGCGRFNVIAFWRHAIAIHTSLDILPERACILMMRTIVASKVKEFKEREIESSKDQ